MLYNKVITEKTELIEMPTDKSEIRCEIKPISSIMLNLSTLNHKGPIKIEIDFHKKCEGDLLW